MTDASSPRTIASRLQQIVSRQGLVVLGGVVSFCIGFFLEPTLLKLLAFLISGVCFSYFVLTFRRKLPEDMKLEGTILPGRTSYQVDEEFGESVHKDKKEIEESVAYRETERRMIQQPTKRFAKENVTTKEFTVEDFFDFKEDEVASGISPKQEFHNLIKRVLAVAKEVNFAYSAAYFWYNKEKNQLIVEAAISDDPKFTTSRKRVIGSDLVSRVVLTAQPVIITNVNATSQQETLWYYDAAVGVQSFVAVPVFYPHTGSQQLMPVGVLAIDCLSEDAYGTETLLTLGHFTKLISGLIRSYTDKYDLLISSELLRAIMRLYEVWRNKPELVSATRALAEESARLVSWDFVTIILFDDKRQAWLVQTVLNRAGDEYVSVGQEIDSDESLVGIALDEAKGRVFNLSEAGLPPRFLKSERERNKGTFLVVPILSAERCFGVVTVESKEDGAYTESDLKTLKQLTDVSSLTFDILSLNDMVQAYIHIDEATGVAGRTFFLERLSEETQRSNDFITDLSLVFVAVDRMDEHINRYGSEGFDFVMRNVGRMIKTSIRQYDILGRYDVNQFAVLLVNTTANEAQIWAEKLRKNIAGNVINIDDKSFSVTVSIGLCPAVDGITDLDLLERTSQVLRKAIEAGGNLVRIY